MAVGSDSVAAVRTSVTRVVGIALLGVVAACGGDDEPDLGTQTPGAPMTIMVSSSEFGDGETIPERFTCDGEDVSPPLEFADVPADAAELALVVEDPDAPSGTFVHWVIWGIDPELPSLGVGEVPAAVTQGGTDFGGEGYGGPCPPAGNPHRYVFTVFALSEPLDLAAGASAGELRDAVAGVVVAEGSFMGLYGRD